MKSLITYIVLITAMCSMAFGYAENNPVLYAPQISPITVDGLFSDWTSSSAWATFGKWYDSGVAVGGTVTGLASTTKARYAWSQTANMLYINVESTEGPGLKLEVGGLYGTLPYNRDTSLNAIESVPVTQIEFSGWSGGTATTGGTALIINEVGGTTSGIQAAYTWDGTTMHIELALPIYADWSGSGQMTLTNSLDVYMYINVFNAAGTHGDSQVANGIYRYLAGGSAVNEGTLVRLRSQAQPVNCADVPYFGKNIADFNGDCKVSFSDFALLAAAWMQKTDPNAIGRIAYVDNYGAVGDGAHDDTVAFQGAASAVQSAGGGAIILGRNKVYRVGQQIHTTGVYPYYQWQPIIEISGATKLPVAIIGNGATLKLNDGLYFGSFDPNTGAVYNPTLPFTNYNYRADAGYVIMITNCNNVEIKELTVDGDIDNLILGGFWGDTGRQCAAYGVYLSGNNNVSVSNVYTHHNGLDGISITWTGAVAGGKTTPHVLNNVESYYNARQGLSWVGGIGLTANNCNFSYTGKERFTSSPGAGLDIEPESSVCLNGTFNNCAFENCTSYGIAVQVSASESGNVFNSCAIQGIWPYSPPISGCTFNSCTIY